MMNYNKTYRVGVKALILMKHFPGKIFNASNCGDNCSKWILKLGEERQRQDNTFRYDTRI